MHRVLFVCTHNSARSQMAEGLLRNFAGDRFEVFSAGTEPGSLHPMAVQAMAEIGVDISRHHSKSADDFVALPLDYVITVCDQARESCFLFPGAATQLHWSLPDPAAVQGDEDTRLAAFRDAREEIAACVRRFITEQSPGGQVAGGKL